MGTTNTEETKMEIITPDRTPQTEAIYQINLRLAEDGGGYTFNAPGWNWHEVLADSWTTLGDNPIEKVGFKIPSGCEVSFRASLLRTALGLAAK